MSNLGLCNYQYVEDNLPLEECWGRVKAPGFIFIKKMHINACEKNMKINMIRLV